MRWWKFVAILGMFLPPSLAIGSYVYIGIFNRMLSDDYCSMFQAQNLGLLRSIWFWYLNWHGGFAASTADWFISLGGSRAFAFHTFVFLAAWLAFSFAVFQKALQRRGYSSSRRLPALFGAVFLVFATLGISPDLSQSLFWWGGVRGYLSPVVLIMLYFALYYHFLSLAPNRFQTALWLSVSFGLSFFIGGFSETFTPMQVVFLAGAAGISWVVSKFNIKNASALFLGAGFWGALIALFIVILAPGNSIRQSYYPEAPNLFTILGIAFSGYFSFLSDIFRSPSMLAAVLGVALGSIWLGMWMKQEHETPAPRGWQVAVLFLTGFVVAFGCFPPSAYGTSTPPPPRTLIIPASVLVLSFLIAGFAFGEWLASRLKDKSFLPASVLLVACGLIVFSSWGTIQYLSSIRDEHAAFAQKWDQVDAQIKEASASGLEVVNIPPMNNWANAQFPTDNPKYYPNLCYSKFYDIQVLAPPRSQQ